MSYEDGGNFDIDQYYSQYEDLNKYKCSYCKSALESDDDCYCGDITTSDKVEQLFNGFIYSNKSFITVIPNSLLDKILSFYISFKKLLSNNKNYKCLLYFNIQCCNITGRICCYQKLLALRGNFYKLLYSGLQFYLWKLKNIDYYNRGINYCCPFEVQYQLSQSELDKYESLLMTVEVVDDFLLMSEADTPNISNSFSEKLVTILPGHHTQHYVDANKKYLFYYNKIYDKDDKLKTLEENKENIRDHLVSIFKEFLACENVYVRYLAPNYYQVSRDGTFGQNLMSMEDINFIYDNILNTVAEQYLLTDNLTFGPDYLEIIFQLEQIKGLNINVEYIQKTLITIHQLVNCKRQNVRRDVEISMLQNKLKNCLNNNYNHIAEGFKISAGMYSYTYLNPLLSVYIKLYGLPTDCSPINVVKLSIIRNLFDELGLNYFSHKANQGRDIYAEILEALNIENDCEDC